MLSAAAFVSAAALLAASVDAHGYMLIPESQFTGSANSAWIVQIDPQWSSDAWDGNNQGSVDAFVAAKSANGYTDLRTLMDDTSVYGADCGFTNPDGTAQPVPTDSKATFSRALVHVGPCEIWLDDTKVLAEDDCYSLYGNEDQDIKSIFPVDYSSCDTAGCSMMRFYWLAFQGVDGDTVWQSYKDCIPLEGGSGTSSSTTTTDAPASEASATDAPSTDAPSTDAPATDAPTTDAPTTDAPTTDAPAAAETPEVTPAPSDKCTGRKRRN
ncbi:hypothetical protein BBJ28_00026044 [Nothophytophthora sp. Chile5]|nr:hypothetical protein BBJ28_00026044 [Nothophytophthora sp. Chile5]